MSMAPVIHHLETMMSAASAVGVTQGAISFDVLHALIAEIRSLTVCRCGEPLGRGYCSGHCDNDE
jgi:CDGSH-type Zn-finger protein